MTVFKRRAAIMGLAIGCTALGVNTLVFSPWQEEFRWKAPLLNQIKDQEAKDYSKLSQEMKIEKRVEELLQKLENL